MTGKKLHCQQRDGIILKQGNTINNIQPYSGLAQFYDQVMDHVDYSSWADYLSMIFKTYGSAVCDVVDCGCGTGSVMQKLEDLGYTVAGFDHSYNMLKEATPKTRGILWQGTLHSLALKKQWDSVLCIYDTIQYLNDEEIKIFVQETNRILTEGGLFIFDIATKKNIKKYWSDFTNKETINGWVVERKSRFEPQKEILYTCFQCSNQSDHTAIREHHIQYIYDLKKYKNIINNNQWKIIGCFHEFTFEPAHHDSERVHFVFRKEGL
ncbi:MAG: class I SAM-dependent methyltransferase [bacterium]